MSLDYRRPRRQTCQMAAATITATLAANDHGPLAAEASSARPITGSASSRQIRPRQASNTVTQHD